MLDSFRNFAYVSSYLHLKSFAWKRDCVISSKLKSCYRVQKAILKSSYRVPQVVSKWKTLKQPVYFLRFIEFWPIFDIQITTTLAIFLEKLQNQTF